MDRYKSEKSVVRKVTGEVLEEFKKGASYESWKNDPIGAGFQNTQQLSVDWSDYSQHVFFNSAEAKVNLAHDQIVNGYPFDGTSQEKLEFMSSIGGFTKYILDQVDSHSGYLNFISPRATSGVWNQSTEPYVTIKDETGNIGEELARSRGKVELNRSIHLAGRTMEFWIYVPNSSSVNRSGTFANQTIYQKVYYDASTPGDPRNNKEGESVWLNNYASGSVDINYLISSDNFKSLYLSASINTDKWVHIAFVYDRAITERINLYVNGILQSYTAEEQSELDDILLPGWSGSIGHIGVRHNVYAKDFIPNSGFYGLIDEFRLWIGTRKAGQIKNWYSRNVDASATLVSNLRFNEPPSSTHSYNAKAICLDCSGTSLHGKIENYPSDNSIRDQYNSIEPPMALEHAEDNKVLFPDWPPTLALNESFLIDANHYDRNNPNLITKLIPSHYFEEAQYFEGISVDFETPEGADYNRSSTVMPGMATIPSRVVILSFLLTWANYFDDMKLYIDAFANLTKVDYDGYDQIPAQLIPFLSDYYGIKLPNPFANEDPSKFNLGENLKNEDGKHVPLSKTVDTMWRRIMINLPFLLRSRGTVQGIRALMNTLGIEPQGVFRLKEYGGAVTKHITSLRERKRKISGFMNFSNINFLESSPLWAYRWAPGAPDPHSSRSPSNSSVLFSSGDIEIHQAGSGPPATLFTSGSWSYEGRYQLLDTETTASLFRIDRTTVSGPTTDTLVNLVAMRQDKDYPDFNVKLFLSGHKSASDTEILEIPGINLWDNKPWYVNISSEMTSDSKQLVTVRLLQTSDIYVTEHHSGSILFERGTGPLFTYTASEEPIFTLGINSSKSYGTTWCNNVSIDSNAVPQIYQGNVQNYSGRLSHQRFWTKALTRSESLEHAQNPFSVAAKNIINQYSFPSSSRFKSATVQNDWDVEGISLAKHNGAYDGTVPKDSWERIRIHHDMLQENTIFGAGSLPANELALIDSSQNNDHTKVNGSNGGYYRELFLYTITPPMFDANVSSNKVRIRSFQDKEKAEDHFVHHGKTSVLPDIMGIDDRRFSIESSIVQALDEDMINVLGDIEVLNNYLGAPELEYAVEYPELKKISDIYFQRLIGKINYTKVIEFQRWFNNNFAELIEQFIPYTADFLGINFIVESHILERHKMEYKQGDVHVDLADRVAFSQEPFFYGIVRSEIT